MIQILKTILYSHSNKTGNKHGFHRKNGKLVDSQTPANTLSMLNIFPLYIYMHLNYLRLPNNVRLCILRESSKTVE